MDADENIHGIDRNALIEAWFDGGIIWDGNISRYLLQIMTRKEELEKIVFKKGTENDIKASRLIDEIIFLEDQMQMLKELPFISVNPKNAAMQKATPAAKQYKEFLQQYNNSLRLLLKLCGDLGESDEESPLRKWARERQEFEN